MNNEGNVKALVEAARGSLQAGNIQQALKEATQAVAADSKHPPALFLLGVALRRNGSLDEAIQRLSEFLLLAPSVVQGRHELALALSSRGQLSAAAVELQKAVDMDPKFSPALLALSDVLLAQGDESAAAKAHARAVLTQDVDPALRKATELFASGRVGVAEGICREYLRVHPTDVNAIRLLGDIGYKLGIMEEAVQLYERCLELAPDYHRARHKYALALSKQDKFEAAMKEVSRLITIDSNNIAYKALHAAVASSAGRFDEAHVVYEDVLARAPDAVAILTSYGHSLRYSGQGEKAATIYRRAIEVDPGHGDAYWSLANLKTVKFTAPEVEEMSNQLHALEGDSPDKYHLAFAVGKALEDLKDYAGSFDAYKTGNEIKRRYSGYDSKDNTHRIDDSIAVCDESFMAQFNAGGHPDSSPIFIVGLPRSGSTLLEQILASHSQVEATAELHFISRIAAQLEGTRKRGERRRYPRLLADLNSDERVALGQQYLDACSVYRTTGKKFIDKLPNNFMHIGLIRAILPNATIIDARRAPMAACFANFKQLFAEGQPFTYSLEDIGHYYVDYHRLMGHWQKIIPEQTLTVHYENVVTDLEGQVARLLEHCSLPFEDACVRFHENDRAVRSASSEQVRQPIFRGGLDQWRHYEEYLGPLNNVLKSCDLGIV
ncbi:MAG: tetratricopeptide repeat protein [Porticoccaceae bacterium]|jgi:tetratricopeptide (TPR) repeat protein|nr:tetratricopeptide repeat protein [Porticoccaceae bacterium]MBT4592426.1 tetratricopeptide repeat protein [Porticoccaceae bacterium]MBT6028501.1 tetratricopeptide repeat protein [Porticoccaceae bacterium]MBT6422937.1 tetratricopeptide repeat protein [Porticoccaceae bacterium]